MTLLIALLFGCPGEDAAPSLAIVAPQDGATVCGSPLEVELEVENFVLVPLEDGLEGEPGTGHVDAYLNGQSATMISGESFAIDGVAPGEYQLRVELVNADHTSLDPYVGEFVYVTVADEACP